MQTIRVLLLCVSLAFATVQLSRIAFNDRDWAAFKECLQSEIDNYDVTVEDGWINVGPVDSRDPDFDGPDALLQKCLIDISSRLLTSGGYNVKSKQVLPVSSVTSEWLRSLGAQSLESIPIAGTLSNGTSDSARDLDIGHAVDNNSEQSVFELTSKDTDHR